VTSEAKPSIELDQDSVVLPDSDNRYYLDFLSTLQNPDDLPEIRKMVLQKIRENAGIAAKNNWILAYVDRLLGRD